MLLSEAAEEALMFSTRLSAIVEISDLVGRDNIIKWGSTGPVKAFAALKKASVMAATIEYRIFLRKGMEG